MRHQRRLVSFMLAGVIVAVGLAVAGAEVVRSQTADNAKAPVHNPDLDLSFAERDAKYQAGWDGFVKRLEAWMASVDTAKVNYEALRHVETFRHGMEPKGSLDEATAATKWIVVVHVEGIRLTAMSGTTVTARVERTLKGSKHDRIQVLKGTACTPSRTGRPSSSPTTRVPRCCCRGTDTCCF